MPKHFGRFVLVEDTLKLTAESLADHAIVKMRFRRDGVSNRPILVWRTVLCINTASLGASRPNLKTCSVRSRKMSSHGRKKDSCRTDHIQLPGVRTHVAANGG